jgi:hypothetical protein
LITPVVAEGNPGIVAGSAGSGTIQRQVAVEEQNAPEFRPLCLGLIGVRVNPEERKSKGQHPAAG